MKKILLLFTLFFLLSCNHQEKINNIEVNNVQIKKVNLDKEYKNVIVFNGCKIDTIKNAYNCKFIIDHNFTSGGREFDITTPILTFRVENYSNPCTLNSNYLIY